MENTKKRYTGVSDEIFDKIIKKKKIEINKLYVVTSIGPTQSWITRPNEIGNSVVYFTDIKKLKNV